MRAAATRWRATRDGAVDRASTLLDTGLLVSPISPTPADVGRGAAAANDTAAATAAAAAAQPPPDAASDAAASDAAASAEAEEVVSAEFVRALLQPGLLGTVCTRARLSRDNKFDR